LLKRAIEKSDDAARWNDLLGDVIDPFQAAGVIRHTFAHGDLLANSPNRKLGNVQGFCNTLSGFLLDVIDREFSAILEGYGK
jgi:hypothetical protein